VVLLIPTGLDLAYHAAHGTWTYAPLADELARRGLPVLDAGPAIARRLGSRAPASIFTDGDLGAHFNAEGYAMLASIVHEHLVSAGLAP
jgi:lysophospholipase L1-like esterase